MRKYYINDCEAGEDYFWDVLSSAIDNEVEWQIDDIIDEENEDINIGSLTYSPSQVLKECDPIAYSCYADDVKNSYFEDDKYYLERGDEVERDDTTFRIEDEEDEDEE